MGGGPQLPGIETMKQTYGDTVTASVEGHVVLLVFDRPPNNFASVEMMRDLADALDDVDADRSLRASVMASGGKSFCAGAAMRSRQAVVRASAVRRPAAISFAAARAERDSGSGIEAASGERQQQGAFDRDDR